MVRPYWIELEEDAIAMAVQHQTYQTSHPGWSFPGMVWSAAAESSQPLTRLLKHAEVRNYQQVCPAIEPGQICPEDGQFVPRGGRFPEGIQPAGLDNWTRPIALEPIPIGALVGPDAELRIHLPLDEAPEALISAIIAAEDLSFREHDGVNYTALLRATWANVQGGGYQQGASTLTMQVVRNLNQRKEKSLKRKIREIISARAIDAHLGKDGVLQMYLDAPYLGQAGNMSICGFAAAARHYWNKDVSELSLSEMATLAGILPAPGRYGPDTNPERARQRRDIVLRRLAEQGWDVTEALAEPIQAGQHPVFIDNQYPAYLQATRGWLTNNLEEQTLYGSGVHVFTALDVLAQETTISLLEARTDYLESIVGTWRRPGPLQSAAVLIAPNTGHMVAVYGGDQALATDFNRATQARRQGGSSFKPVVYAMAFSATGSDGRPTWTSMDTVSNLRRVFPRTNGWNPRNISGEYTATSTLIKALSWSQNVATASLLYELGGPEPLIKFANAIGYDTSSYPEEMGLALGQGEVTLVEQTRFVAMVINGGRTVTGQPVTHVFDAADQSRWEGSAMGGAFLSADAAAMTRELMRQVILNGTGGASRGSGGFPGYTGPAIGKTGTTDQEKDLWFIGGTPFYAGTIWLGYDQPHRIGASASDLAAPLWGWWMHAVHQGFEKPEFDGPTIRRRTVCSVSGQHGNETCPLIGAPYLEGQHPTGECEIEHPPPDPEKTSYKSIWTRKQEEEAEEASRDSIE